MPPGIQARIVDGNDNDCARNAAGELLLKGENIFAGYWRRPRETRAAFTADGWFRTGDIAICDDEGYYWLVDRKKDMFISGGENVYPAEVEFALAGFPGIVEAVVVGVPDVRWGEVGHLAIVLREGVTIGHPEILDYLGPRIARYKLPKYTTAIENLPRTGSGKVKKRELRSLLIDSES